MQPPQNPAAPRSALSFQAERGVILLTRNDGPQWPGPSNEVLQNWVVFDRFPTSFDAETQPPKSTVNTKANKNDGVEINPVKGSANISKPALCLSSIQKKTMLWFLGWIHMTYPQLLSSFPPLRITEKNHGNMDLPRFSSHQPPWHPNLSDSYPTPHLESIIFPVISQQRQFL